MHNESSLDPLNVQCRKESLKEMSNVIHDWRTVGMNLLGTESFQKIDIDVLSTLEADQERMIKILHTWHEVKGVEATYAVLVQLLESTNNHDAANTVRALAMENSDDHRKYCIDNIMTYKTVYTRAHRTVLKVWCVCV